jgi:DNA-binding PadR family transcriptional regulator
MSIASDLIRGHTDTIILARLVGGDNYGYEINKSIQLRTGGKYELKEATLYTAFRRLEQAGCISSYWGDEQTGARRRYYSITDTGRETFGGLIDEWKTAKATIDKLIETEEDEDGR